MKITFRNPVANLLVAAALFLAAFLSTRAFLARDSSSKIPEDVVTTVLPNSGTGGQSLLPGDRNRGNSRLGESSGSREFFRRWKAANEIQDDAAAIRILREWALAAPESGIELALKENQPDLAWQLAIHWAEFDDRAAVSAAKNFLIRSTSDSDNRGQLWNVAARKRLREAPEEIAALLSDFPLGLKSRVDRIPETELGDLDPARQAAALEKISERWVKSRFARPVLTKWARTDPEAALQWSEENLSDPEGWTLAALLRGWAAKDPEAAAQRIPGPGNSLKRTRAIKEFLAGATENDPEFALEWAAGNFDESIEAAVRQQLPGGTGDPMALQKLYQELIGRGLIETNPNSGSFQSAAKIDWPPQTETDVRHWAQANFYSGSKSSPRTWKVEEVQAATAFLIENPDLARSAGWHRDLSERWAKENPQAALEWSASLPPELQIEAAESALEAWYQLEPNRVITFTESLPESEFRGYAIEKVTGDWVQSDPDAAIHWAASLPAGSDRDTAASRISRHFRFRDPARAVAVAGSIENEALRLDNLISIVDVWTRRDPAKAEAFVKEAQLSEPERKALLDRLSRP